MTPFDPVTCPLEGSHLIEASAGTGKTFTIAGLYLRFIVETGLSAEQILVVTFTEAATKELRERIRLRLRKAADALTGSGPEDSYLADILAKGIPAFQALASLTEALRSTDQAAIYTIHGFCRRILTENAFESGSLFDTELITSQDDLMAEIVEDFWRKRFYDAPTRLVRFLLGRKLSPHAFLDVAADAARHLDVRVIPEVSGATETSLIEALDELCTAVDALASSWDAARDEVVGLLGDPFLNATSYGSTQVKAGQSGPSPREAKIRTIVSSVERFLQTRDPECPLPLCKELALLTESKVRKSVKKGGVYQDHRIFGQCEAIARYAAEVELAGKAWLIQLRHEVLQALHDELPRRKRERNVQHFDDLLLKLRDSLRQNSGESLAARVREQYRAALIDEFQDTDAIQYAIFQSLFGDGGKSLFLIGDPKQAIYAFRGADVFAYMEAAGRVEHRSTLPTNWRSEAGLIQAVNTLFSCVEQAFVYPEIRFEPVQAPGSRPPASLTVDGEPVVPFQLWFLERERVEGATKAINKPDAVEWMLRSVGAEISRLLNLAASGRASIGTEPLRESDMAILVRTNRQARLAQRELARLSIPCVLYSTDDVFDSHEAEELERVLAAIVENRREALLRGALLTDLLGGDGGQLAAMTTDDRAWEARLDAFQAYNRTWHEQGFIRMFRTLMVQEQIRNRLIALVGGERRLTNLLHLAELLHESALNKRLEPPDLLRWLAQRRDPSRRREEEQQLRLESDDRAVRIVTIHRSKGLEYPVVFCPFTWESSRQGRGDSPLVFHDEDNGRAVTLDFGSDQIDRHLAWAERENLAENLRLLYVAVTRARTCCHLHWGSVNTAESSALAYLLHSRGKADFEDVVTQTEDAFKGMDDPTLLCHIEDIVDRSSGCIALRQVTDEPGSVYRPTAQGNEPLHCRTFQGTIDRSWRISSFSSLIAGAFPETPSDDRDDLDVAAPTAEEYDDSQSPSQGEYDFFAFPRGPKAGVVLHEIFEEMDFQARERDIVSALVRRKLDDYGFEPHWSDAVEHMIENVLSLPLGRDGEIFTLGDIPLSERLVELEFHFPISHLTPGLLHEAVIRGLAQELPTVSTAGDTRIDQDGFQFDRLSFQPVKGFMKGFIDLVFRHGERFYLVDWKSNHLGRSLESYMPEALARVMTADHYNLQYLLYTVALDRYLDHRLPGYDYDRHFGEVYYFFLRGIDPAAGQDYGLFRARPPREVIAALSTRLFSGGESA